MHTKTTRLSTAILAVALGACSKAADDEKSSGKDSAASNAASSDTTGDDDGVDQPTMVNGSWIVDCEPIATEVRFVTPDPGETVGGCSVLSAETHERAAIEQGSLTIKLATPDGAEYAAESVLPPLDSPFDFYVTISPAQLSKLIILAISFIDKISKAAQEYSTDELKSDATNIGGKLIWEQFGPLVNDLELPTSELKPMPADGKHLLFVTHKVHGPDFGGLAGADGICANAGKEVDPDRTWIALLSSSTVDLRDRLTINGPVYNLMANMVAKDADQLWNAADDHLLGSAVIFTEKGFDTREVAIKLATLELRVNGAWTGSTGDGRYDPDRGACKDWTSKELKDTASTGSTYMLNKEWLYTLHEGSCSHMNRLYCISG